MKKYTLLFAAIAVAASVFAQSGNQKPTDTKLLDTLWGPVFNTTNPCKNDPPSYFSINSFGGTGYLTGNGKYYSASLMACSQAVDNTSAGYITNVIAKIKKISGSSGSFTAKVYSVDNSMKPTTLLGTSAAVNMGSLTAGEHDINFTFSPAISVGAVCFAIAITYPTPAGDTIVVGQTNFGCVYNYQNKNQYAYMNVSGTWFNYMQLMSQQSPPLSSFDLFIGAIKSTSVGIAENPLNATLSLYPNPAGNNINIVSLSDIEKINVMNCLGQSVISVDAAGKFFNLNTSFLNPGIYIVQIETEKGSVVKKITVSR